MVKYVTQAYTGVTSLKEHLWTYALVQYDTQTVQQSSADTHIYVYSTYVHAYSTWYTYLKPTYINVRTYVQYSSYIIICLTLQLIIWMLVGRQSSWMFREKSSTARERWFRVSCALTWCTRSARMLYARDLGQTQGRRSEGVGTKTDKLQETLAGPSL